MAAKPKPYGNHQGKHFEAEVAALQRNDLFPEPFHDLTNPSRAARSLGPSIFSVTLPLTTSATVPSCSETTIATASVSSVTPRAARGQVPQVFFRFGAVRRGSKHPAPGALSV